MRHDHKEILGKLFRGYVNIRLNPQSQYRNDAAIQMSEALNELQTSGISFDEHIKSEMKELLMLTDNGLQQFIEFVRNFMVSSYNDESDMSDIVDEQIRIAKWVNEHRKELVR